MRTKSPKLAAILRTDFFAIFGALMPVIGLALGLFAAYGMLPDRSASLREGRVVFIPSNASVVLASIPLAIGAVLLTWRVTRIRAAFASGLRVAGRVTRLRPFKDRAYVHYAFEVNGRRHETTHFVHQSAAYRRLAVGQEVQVAVDPRRPGAAFITALFEPLPPATN